MTCHEGDDINAHKCWVNVTNGTDIAAVDVAGCLYKRQLLSKPQDAHVQQAQSQTNSKTKLSSCYSIRLVTIT